MERRLLFCLPVCLPVAYVLYFLACPFVFLPVASSCFRFVFGFGSGPPYKNLGTRDMGKHRYHSPVRIRWPKWRVYLALARM